MWRTEGSSNYHRRLFECPAYSIWATFRLARAGFLSDVRAPRLRRSVTSSALHVHTGTTCWPADRKMRPVHLFSARLDGLSQTFTHSLSLALYLSRTPRLPLIAMATKPRRKESKGHKRLSIGRAWNHSTHMAARTLHSRWMLVCGTMLRTTEKLIPNSGEASAFVDVFFLNESCIWSEKSPYGW